MAFREFTAADWTVVRTLLPLEGGIDRAVLADASGLSPATLSGVINGLDKRGLIERTPKAEGVGRPSETIALFADQPLVLGVHMADGGLDLALTGLDGRLRRRRSHMISHHADWESASLIRKTLREWRRARERPEHIIAIFIAVELEPRPSLAHYSVPKRMKMFAEGASRLLERRVTVMSMTSAMSGQLAWHRGASMPEPCLVVWLGPEIEARILEGGRERAVSVKAGGDIPPGDSRTLRQILGRSADIASIDARQLERAERILALANERVSDWIARAGVHGAPGPVASILAGGLAAERIKTLLPQVRSDLNREISKGSEPPPVKPLSWTRETAGLLPARAGLAKAGLHRMD